MVKGLRVDSLGYDEESNSFVIVEYKRDKHSSVFDQGVAYLALMLNNKQISEQNIWKKQRSR
jgi:RecB family endonuclease NucS